VRRERATRNELGFPLDEGPEHGRVALSNAVRAAEVMRFKHACGAEAVEAEGYGVDVQAVVQGEAQHLGLGVNLHGMQAALDDTVVNPQATTLVNCDSSTVDTVQLLLA
jgi:hypothetical protein